MSTSVVDPEGSMGPEVKTVFRVTKAIKGSSVEERVIFHFKDTGGNCGIDFEKDKTYVIDAWHSSGKHRTAICSWTGPVGEFDSEKWIREELSGLDQDSDDDDRRQAAEWVHMILDDEDRRKFIDEYAGKFDEVASDDEMSFNDLTELGDYAWEWRDFERAAEAYQAANQVLPVEPITAEKLAESYFKLGEFETSIPMLKRVLEADPNAYRVRILLSQALLVTGHRQDHQVHDYRELIIRARDFSNLSANGHDFSETSFSKIDFTNANLHYARFDKANLDHVNFDGAHLEGSSFASAKLGWYLDKGVSFKGANLTGARLLHTDAGGADFTEARLNDVVASHFAGYTASFIGAEIRNSSLPYSNLSRANLTSANLNGTNLRFANLSQSDLSSANLTSTDLKGANFLGARVNCETRLPLDFDQLSSGVIPVQPQCDGKPQNRDFSRKEWGWRSDFTEIDLTGASFEEAKFDNARFFGANLTQAKFGGSSGMAHFAGTNLSGTSFFGTKIDGFFGKNGSSPFGDQQYGFPILDGTDFSRAELTSKNFFGYSDKVKGYADLSTAVFKDVSYACPYSRTTDSSWEEKRLAKLRAGDSENDIPDEKVSQEQRDERIRFLEERIAEKKRYIANELSLVTFFVENWPETRFDESCQVYLDKIER